MRIILLVLIMALCHTSYGQKKETFTLDDIIVLAQSESPQVKLAEMRKSNAYWNNQSFLADYRPQIDLDIVLPSLNRSVALIDLPDGTSGFRQRSQMTNNVSLSLRQNITATGATVFASASLERLDIFATDNAPGTQSYRSNPLFFGFTQPLLSLIHI